LAELCASSFAQEDTASYWLNKGNESREMAINETQNQTARELFLQEALKAYDEAIEIDPQSASSWFKKGELHIDFLGNFEEALHAFNKSTEINPQFADAWYQKGKALTAFGYFEEAVKSYNESLKINPNSSEAWYWKAGVLAELGRAEEAVPAYDEAIETNPENVMAWQGKVPSTDFGRA
jgi:tetratricopeptide (TPR) repeat protein